MDLFFNTLAIEQKRRIHFYRFMQQIHRELQALSGTPNPLKLIASRIAQQIRVLCFDEFFVSDIGDAMLLGTLLQELFSRGVVLVSTSNCHPDQLYRDGLQRQRFLPAIEQIKRHTQVLHLNGDQDFRLRPLDQVAFYHTPLSHESEAKLHNQFLTLAPGSIEEQIDLEVESRLLPSCRISSGIAWFKFSALCDGPRSQNDYIALSKRFHTILISDVPALGGVLYEKNVAGGAEDKDLNENPISARPFIQSRTDDQARRFISLVDEFYDRGVKLILSAAVPIEKLYQGGNVGFEFERTTSRLLEMQSLAYQQRPHTP
jgi:cell division protein ZapE